MVASVWPPARGRAVSAECCAPSTDVMRNHEVVSSSGLSPGLDRDRLVDAIVHGPLGACLIDRLASTGEAGQSASALRSAVSDIEAMPWPALRSAILETSSRFNPWCGDGATIAERISLAPRHRLVAEALVDTHTDVLTAPVAADSQEFWLFARQELFTDLTHVYECGEFPWQALRSWGHVPDDLHEAHCSAHDGASDCTRWSMRADPAAPVFEVNLPEDWAALVQEFPGPPTRAAWVESPDGTSRLRHFGHNAWSLRISLERVSATNDPDPVLTSVEGIEYRGASLVMPAWPAVAAVWAGVHLTWAGLLTSQGKVSDVGNGQVTVLEYWHSEQTCWLKNAVLAFEPLPGPFVTLGRDGENLHTRRTEDFRHLDRIFRRDPPATRDH